MLKYSSRQQGFTIQGLESIIKNLQNLLQQVKSDESIIDIEVDHKADLQQGAPPGVDMWETLYTGSHHFVYKINVLNIKQAEEFTKQSARWNAFA